MILHVIPVDMDFVTPAMAESVTGREAAHGRSPSTMYFSVAGDSRPPRSHSLLWDWAGQTDYR
jgi:hypothetical protein